MAKDKKISQVSVADKVAGDELMPFAKNGENGAIATATILAKADATAKDYADTAEANANKYTDTAKAGAINSANEYTNTKLEPIEDAQASDLAKITELQGKLNGVENLSDELSKIPTLQQGSMGGEKNYIYSDPTIQGKGAIAAARYRPKENGRLAAQYKYWGDTDFNHNTEFPQATTTTDGVMSASDKSNLEGIIEKIPSQASADNQLADKDFVNSSIATNTAEFKGTYNSLAELERVTADANDYGFVVSKDVDGNTVYNRYKWTESGWQFEYTLNNSSFTAKQWETINSGITANSFDALETLAESVNQGLGETIARVGEIEDELVEKADIKALSNILGDEVIDETTFENFDKITREELKKDLFVDLWNQACSVRLFYDGKTQEVGRYNEATGFFELNGLTDITYAQALDIYNNGRFDTWEKGLYTYSTIRTNLPHLCWANGNRVEANNLASNCRELEVFLFPSPQESSFGLKTLFYTFRNCAKLRSIYGRWNVTDTSTCDGVFDYCSELEYIERMELGSSATKIQFRHSPKLNLQTFQNIVKYSTTSACTITVHADVYGKLTDESNTDWHQVLTDAMAKNIQFVSA